MLKRFSTRDLIIISTLAAIGIAVKPLVNPLFKTISTPLMVPGGSFAGGFYMMWLSLAMVLTRKSLSGALFGFLQALIVIMVGMMGNHGAISLLTYFLPGVVADIVFLAFGKQDGILTHIGICTAANITGAVIMAILIFSHPMALILAVAGMACVSGIVGGLLSHMLYSQLKTLKVIV